MSLRSTADPNGLSAYVDWLKTDVLLPGTVHQAEIEQRFPQRDLKRLNRAVVAGEQLASSAWSKPGSAVRVTQKEKRRIDKMLSEIVTKEKASDALYKACFPDQVLVDEYVDNVAEAKRKEKEAEVCTTGTRSRRLLHLSHRWSCARAASVSVIPVLAPPQSA